MRTFSLLAVALLLVLMISGLGLSAADGPANAQMVHLINGYDVIIGDGTVRVVIPPGCRTGYEEVRTDGDLFVVPKPLNPKFDRSLFDVSYLIREGYTKLSFIPVVIEVQRPSLNDVESALEGHGAVVVGSTRCFGFIFARVPVSSQLSRHSLFEFLDRSNSVIGVWLDLRVHAVNVSGDFLVGATGLWKSGINGTDQVIAMLDTGIDPDNPALKGKVVLSRNFVEGEGPDDLNGHGTHCAGIAAAHLTNASLPLGNGGSRVLVNQDVNSTELQVYLNDYSGVSGVKVGFRYNLTLITSNGTACMTGEIISNGSMMNKTMSFDVDGDGGPDEIAHAYLYAFTTSNRSTLNALVRKRSGSEWKVVYGLRELLGVAPAAKLWNLKVLDSSGNGYASWVIEALELAALGPDGLPRTGDEADVVSMSLSSTYPTDGTDPLSLAVDLTASQGVPVVVAAGNSGDNLIGTPSSARSAITVGSVNEELDISSFSSRGPTADYRVKPDLVAPGESVISSVPYDLFHTYVLSESGTSMATPFVSGAVALIRQAHPDWTPTQIVDAIECTARDLGQPPFEQGAGLLNAELAVKTPLLIHPAILSLGVVNNRSISFSVSIKGLNQYPLSLLVSGELEGPQGDVSPRLNLSSTMLELPPRGSRTLGLRLNLTNLTVGLYYGKVHLEDSNTNRSWHFTFGFYLNSTAPSNLGRLRVQTVPPVPTTIYVNGVPRDDWGLNWVRLPAGSYEVSFSGVPGWLPPERLNVTIYPPGNSTYIIPANATIPIYPGHTTEVKAPFIRLGSLRVETSPPIPARIYVNGTTMDEWGIWVSLRPGHYLISFEPYPGYKRPRSMLVYVGPGECVHVIGHYDTGDTTLETSC